MNKFYRLDSRKLSYGEYWNVTRSWQVIIPWTAKLLGIPMKFGSGLPSFESVRELEVPEVDFSLRAREKLQPLLDKCLMMGFHSPRFFTFESMRRDTRTSFIALLHGSGATVRLMHTLASRVQPPKEKILVALLSELRDGTYFCTVNQRKQFLSAPGILVNRLVGARPERLLESHLQKLTEFQSNNPAKPVNSVEQLDEVWDRYEKLSRDFGMQRGIYVWMTPEEVAAEQQGLTEATAQAGAGGKNLDVLLELHRLQNQKSGWGSMIVLLLVSLGLFIGAGARQWQWNYLFILLGVLFVHELGHYLAMRAFNYRNVRMFFIPFFGAAVSGQNHNVPGWKKVMVSLMGPVPGIVLGVILGVAGIALHQPILIKIAIVSLLLNGFNLLPVLPLDGGWVFHTLLFSRHYVLDAGFRVLAAVALIVGGPLIGARILMYLGILMLIGVPASYRMARIAADLRERGLPPVPPDEQTIPAETAQKIIAEVKQAATKPQSNKMVAQQALQIFETLNARPPGWAATIGLLFAHGASFAMAAVFALAFVIAQRGDLRDLIANAAQMPKHKLICGSTQVWGSRQAGPDSAPQITVIATFARRTEAATVFQDLTNRIPATASLERFGDSLLLSLPPDDDALRKKWVDDLQARTKDVFVDSTNFPASFSLVCIAPDKKTAEAITGELEGYFNTLPNLALVPPWLPKDGRSTAERAQHDLARQTYLKLQKAESAGYDDAALKDLQSKIAIARKQGGQAEVKALRDQINERVQSLAQTNIARAGTGTGGAVDARVVELFARLSASATGTNGPDQGIQLELAQRMGQLAVVNGTVDKRYAARFGVAAQNGLLIKVPWVSFECIDTGPAALADWLCGKGCVDLKYDFQSGAAWADEAPE